MGYELDKLMATYGVSSPTMAGIVIPDKPRAPASTAPKADLDKYYKDLESYENKRDFETEWKKRLATGSIYTQSQFGGVSRAPTWASPLQMSSFGRAVPGYPSNQVAPPPAAPPPAAPPPAAPPPAAPPSTAPPPAAPPPAAITNPPQLGSLVGTQQNPPGFVGPMDPLKTTAAKTTAQKATVPKPTAPKVVAPFGINIQSIRDALAKYGIKPTFGDGGSVDDRLEELFSKYAAMPEAYSSRIEEARSKSKEESDKLLDLIQQAGRSPQSSSETWFRIAAALGKPTRTGTFGEELSNLNETLADTAKAREAARLGQLQLGIEAQKMRAGLSKEDLATARSEAEEAMKDRRSLLGKMLELEVARGKPMSEAGKMAMDEGLQPGSPEYLERVKQLTGITTAGREAAQQATEARVGAVEAGLDVQRRELKLKEEKAAAEEAARKDKESKLTAPELKEREQVQEMLRSTKESLKMLSDAYAANANAFDSDLLSSIRKMAIGKIDPQDPQLLASQNVENALMEVGGNRIKQIFGANPSQTESEMGMKLIGAREQNKTTRDQIIKRTAATLLARQKDLEARLKLIESGEWGKKSLPSEVTPDGQ